MGKTGKYGRKTQLKVDLRKYTMKGGEIYSAF